MRSANLVSAPARPHTIQDIVATIEGRPAGALRPGLIETTVPLPRSLPQRLRLPRQPLVIAVDDEPAILRLIVLILHEMNLRVLPALSAEMALDLMGASEEVPDLAVIDIQLPGIDGIALTEQLKHDDRYSSMPVLLISAFGEPGTHQADAFLPKPFDADELIRAVQTLVVDPGHRSKDR